MFLGYFQGKSENYEIMCQFAFLLNCFLCDNFLSNQAESHFCDKKVNTSGSEDSSDHEDFMNLDDGLTVNSITSFDQLYVSEDERVKRQFRKQKISVIDYFNSFKGIELAPKLTSVESEHSFESEVSVESDNSQTFECIKEENKNHIVQYLQTL